MPVSGAGGLSVELCPAGGVMPPAMATHDAHRAQAGHAGHRVPHPGAPHPSCVFSSGASVAWATSSAPPCSRRTAPKRSWKCMTPKREGAWTSTRWRSAPPSDWSNEHDSQRMDRHDRRGAAAAGARPDAPAAPVSIAKCASYDEDVTAKLAAMFDQLGGLEKLVRNKTVTVKVNMTGRPGQRVQGLAPALTHYTHPKLRGRDGLPDGTRRGEAHPLRRERLGDGGSARRRDARFRLERAQPAIGGSPAWSSKTPTRSARARSMRASKCPGTAVHVPGVRPEPRLRRHRRLRQHGQAQESRRPAA